MRKFIALYCLQSSQLQEWMKKPLADRESEEKRLKDLWDTWATAQGAALLLTAGAGKTTRVTAFGAIPASNDIMMYSIVEAETPEQAEAMFINHPHLQIPGAWIDVMIASKMGV